MSFSATYKNLIILYAVFFCSAGLQAQIASVTDLGLSGFGTSINSTGQVAGRTGPEHAFFWQKGTGAIDLGTLGGTRGFSFSFALQINNAGQVIGVSTTNSGSEHAFVWQDGKGMTDLGTLPGGSGSSANRINASGQIIGTSNEHAVIWRQDKNGIYQIADLGSLGGTSSFPEAINAAGTVVGESQPPTGGFFAFRAFLWQDGKGMIDLGNLPGGDGQNTSASDINDAGQVVGSSATAGGASHAFVWQADTGMIDLTLPGGSFSEALHINARGQIIGDSTDASGHSHGVLWQQDETGAYQPTILETAELIAARISISPRVLTDRGQILASASDDRFFVWQNGSLVDLGKLFPFLNSDNPVSDMNDAGQIVGCEDPSFNAAVLQVPLGCQVNVAPLLQCQGKNLNPPPGHWGGEQYAYHVNSTMCGLGCLTTALSMDLISQGVSQIPLCTGFLNCSGLPLVQNDPGTLNSFMTRVDHDQLGDYSLSSNPNDNNNVIPEVATLDLAFELSNSKLIFDNTGHAPVYFVPQADASQPPIPGDPARGAVDAALCVGRPVIVRVTGSDGNFGTHKVLVTGKQGDDYLINDPAGAAPGSTCDRGPSVCLCPLADASGTRQPKPCKLLSQYGRFNIVGSVKDPPGDRSNLNVAVDTSADLFLTDALGRRAGLDPSTGLNLEEIPQSAHVVDAIDNEETGEPPLGLTHWVNVFQAMPGAYDVTVTGLEQGSYIVTMNTASSDGSPQPMLSLPGIAGVGSTSTFRLQFGSAQGAASSIIRIATFQDTLNDVSNSLQLGLIDNNGVANSLSRKIEQAADTTGRNETNILNAFINEVQAQSNKHITGAAVQVLLEDAKSLISQSQ